MGRRRDYVLSVSFTHNASYHSYKETDTVYYRRNIECLISIDAYITFSMR